MTTPEIRDAAIAIVRRYVGEFTSARLAGAIADEILELQENRRLAAIYALRPLVNHLRSLSGSAGYAGDASEAFGLIRAGETALKTLEEHSND